MERLKQLMATGRNGFGLIWQFLRLSDFLSCLVRLRCRGLAGRPGLRSAANPQDVDDQPAVTTQCLAASIASVTDVARERAPNLARILVRSIHVRRQFRLRRKRLSGSY
jgi:hypothetical protein